MSEIINAQDIPPLTREGLLEWTKTVLDPDLGISIVDLGLVYGFEISEDKTSIKTVMTLTSPGCPSAGSLVEQMKKRVAEYPGVTQSEVELVFDPKWDPKTMASEETKEMLGIW